MKKTIPQYRSHIINSRRNIVFKIVTLLIPVLIFVIFEFSLRLFNYGPNLSLFIEESVNGKSYYTMNPTVISRYFNKINFTPLPSPEFFPVDKLPGTYRIFCLGESTTVGFPYWYNGSFPSFLRDRLKAIFPGRSIEVINLGITATNSFTVLDISNDLINYEPDIIIVYGGHNEFYGVLGAASSDRVASSRWMTLLYLRIVNLRTYQFIKNITSGIIGIVKQEAVNSDNRTTMMEQVAQGKNVPYGDEVYKKALSNFQDNMKDLSKRCRDRNIPLILGTQVSNIKDQYPFISNNSRNLSEQQRNEFQQFYSSGMEFKSKGIIDSAIMCFRSGIALDSLYADIHYQLARCLDMKGQKQEAYSEYIFARDYDELRFRADSRLNELVRQMEYQKYSFVADIEAVFKSHSTDSLIGYNLILEHLHPNTRGHFYIAKEYACIMRNHGLLAVSEEWAKCDTLTDEFLWENRQVTDVDEFFAAYKTEYLTSSWPFKSRNSAVSNIAGKDTIQKIAEQAARNQINWENAHSRAVDYYLQNGSFKEAEREIKTIINQFPLDIASHLRLAQLYFNQQKYTDAERILLASLQIQQTPITLRILGDTYLKLEKPESAVKYYEELNKFPANPAISAENAYMLAVAYLFSKKPDTAIRTLERTINLYPAYKPAKELLLRIRLLEGKNPVQ